MQSQRVVAYWSGDDAGVCCVLHWERSVCITEFRVMGRVRFGETATAGVHSWWTELVEKRNIAEYE